MNLRVTKISGIIGLIIALAVVTIVLLPESQSQATPPDVEEQNQVSEEQISPQHNATATITITMTTVSDDNPCLSPPDREGEK